MNGHALSHQPARLVGPCEMNTSATLMIERLAGPLSANKLAHLTRDFVRRWDPALRVHLLVDLRSAELKDIGFGDLLGYVRHTEQLGLHQMAPRVAIVAGGDNSHTLARLYQSLVQNDNHCLAVFTDPKKALSWIRDEREPAKPLV